MKFNVLFLFVSLSLLSIYSNAQEPTIEKYTNLSLDFETRATDLVAQMTLEEKISQLGAGAPAIPRLNIHTSQLGRFALRIGYQKSKLTINSYTPDYTHLHCCSLVSNAADVL